MRHPRRPMLFCLCVCILTASTFAASACRSPQTGPQDEPTAASSPTAEPTKPPEPATPAPTPTTPPPQQEGSGDSDAQVPEGVELGDCPPAGRTMVLKFSAHITIQYGTAQLTHSLEDGVLNLGTYDGDGGAIEIRGAASPEIPYLMSGTMEECSFEGEGTMTPSAEGYCEGGIVYLTITENWGEYKGKMTCEGKTVPFNIPAMGAMEHTGADGRGEVFYLDVGFSSEGAGYTTIREYAGPSGSGDHIWTLFYDYTGPAW